MCDARLYALPLGFDEDLSAETERGRCQVCVGSMSGYPREPRVPKAVVLPEEYVFSRRDGILFTRRHTRENMVRMEPDLAAKQRIPVGRAAVRAAGRRVVESGCNDDADPLPAARKHST